MNSKKSMIGGIVIVLVVVAIIIFAVTGKDDDTSTNSTDTTSTSSTSPADSSSDSDATPADTASEDSATANVSVAITNFAYAPKEITVKVGTTVTWTNNDDVGHTVTASTKSDDAPDSETFGKGEKFSYTFKKAGTYDYFCAPHPYMKGTVTVTE